MNRLAKGVPMEGRQSALLSVVIRALASREVARFGKLVGFVAAIHAHVDAFHMPTFA